MTAHKIVGSDRRGVCGEAAPTASGRAAGVVAGPAAPTNHGGAK